MEFKQGTVEYRCDACGKILRGYEKAVMKHESYISIKGDICLQLWDEETKQGHFAHIIPIEKPLVTVCDLKCLDIYIKFQHIQYMNKRDRHLRYEATIGQIRPSEAYTPPNPTRPRFEPMMKGKYDKRH